MAHDATLLEVDVAGVLALYECEDALALDCLGWVLERVQRTRQDEMAEAEAKSKSKA